MICRFIATDDVKDGKRKLLCANCELPHWSRELPEKIARKCKAVQEKERVHCQHLGQPTGFVECPTCQGNVRLKVFGCEIHNAATMKKPMAGIACCATCREYVAIKDFADSDGSAAG